MEDDDTVTSATQGSEEREVDKKAGSPSTHLLDDTDLSISSQLNFSRVVSNLSQIDKNDCPCSNDIPKSTMICCDNCNQWWHTSCVNLKGISENAIKGIDWCCPHCYISPYTPTNMLETMLKSVQELSQRDISCDLSLGTTFDLKRTVSEAVTTALKSFSSEAQSMIMDTTKVTVEKATKEMSAEASKTYLSAFENNVSKTVEERSTTTMVKKVVSQIGEDNQEREKRKYNVVINNVIEETDKDRKSSNDQDMKFLLNTCGFKKQDVVRCFRAGKFERPEKGSKTLERPLVVQLKTTDDADYYSNYGKGFRVVDESNDSAVYWVNPDLIRADREAQFFVRQERRKRQQAQLQQEEKKKNAEEKKKNAAK